MDGSRSGGRTMRCGSSTAARAPVPLRELEARITELAGQLNAATYRLLALIAEFGRRHGWGRAGPKSVDKNAARRWQTLAAP
jgi:hypothetical protein